MLFRSGRILADALARDCSIDENDALVLAAMANGSYSRALALKDADWRLHRDWLIDEVIAMDENQESTLLAFAEKLAREKQYAVEALEVIKTWFRDLIIAKYRLNGILHADLADKVREMSQKRSENEWIKRIRAVQQAQQAIDSNANPRLVLENLVLSLAE